MKIRSTPQELSKKEAKARLTSTDNPISLPPNFPLTKEELVKFEEDIIGRIVYPWTPDYPLAKREFNDVYPASPVMIVFVANHRDIQLCLEMAQNGRIETTIRSGRHSLTDYSVCNGMVIDISELKNVKVDPIAQTVWVEAGINFEHLYPKVEQYNMHLPGGGCPTVSVAGYMQGGGYSLTSRTFGIQSDLVISFTMILASGKIVVANANQNVDLFWAVRGGTGGNFGVLVDITYKIFPLDLMWGIAIEWDFEDDNSNAAQALYVIQEQYLKGYQQINMGIETIVYTDIAHDGHRKVRFGGGFIGNKDELDVCVEALIAVPGAQIVYLEQGKYSEINNNVLEGIPAIPESQLPGIKFYGRSNFVDRSLSVDDYKNILSFFKTVPNTYGMIDMEGFGGTINRYPVEGSAFIHRNAILDFYTIVFFDKVTNDQEENRVWINSFYEFMAQYCNGHTYQNYPNRDQTDWKWAYWGPYYNQLVQVKQKYDPSNFFTYPQAIGAPIDAAHAAEQKMLFENAPIIYEKY
jgi:FAD/FMN-containing dehydrogenase